ncbi:MAG: DUF2207 domain-containing protein [Clostridiales bacterium]|nr:DUF2207 domain-containing protein [Clostridiales bacterium]
MSFKAFMVFAVLTGIGLLFSLFCILIGVIQRKVQTRTVEFYPPKGCSPLDVLIMYKGKHADPRAVFNPLCLYWADKGLITIKEDCKRGLVLHKKKEFPDHRHYFQHYSNSVSRTTYGLEKQFFEYLFADGDTFYTLTAQKTFNEKYEELRGNIKEVARENQVPLCKKLFVLPQIVSGAIYIAFEIYATAATHFPYIVLTIFSFIGILMLRYAPLPGMIRVPFFSVWGGVPTFVMLMFGKGAMGLGCLVMLTQFILTVFVLTRFVDIRSIKSLQAYAAVDSFRQFLLEAEQERVELLVEENPRYYYNILPYCYILNVTEKMKVKFDRIMMEGPAWFLGDIRNTLMF